MTIPQPLIDDIVQGRCLPFVGSGFSKNATLPSGSRMPDWQELASFLASEAGVDEALEPPAIAEEYQRRFGRVQLIEAIRAALHSDEVQPGRAHSTFCQLPFDTVYTTNFDLLLEMAYTESGRPFRSLVGERQIPFHAGRLCPNVVKMHGDLRHEEHIVVTKTDYDQFVEAHPVVATHLSAMLITRTPLFIGYSLSDPDFQQIRSVVRARLGAFARMSYVLQFDSSEEDIASALKENIHVISLAQPPTMSRDEVLNESLQEILGQVDENSTLSLRDSRPEAFEDLEMLVVKKAVEYAGGAQILEASSRLCFVMMPFGDEFESVYRELISPAVLDAGLKLWRVKQISAPGAGVEQVRASIRQARLCVADITGGNPNVLYEMEYAQALDKPLVLLARAIDNVPLDLRHLRILVYGDAPSESRQELRTFVSYAAYDKKLEKAEELIGMGQYSAAIAATAVVLEQHVREVLSKHPPRDLDRMTLGQLVTRIQKREKLDPALAAQLADVVGVRNSAVHQIEERSQEEAQSVLEVVRDVLAALAVGQGQGEPANA